MIKLSKTGEGQPESPVDPAKPVMTADEITEAMRQDETDKALAIKEQFVSLLHCSIPIRDGSGELIINRPLMEALLKEYTPLTYADLHVLITHYKYDGEGNVEVCDGFFVEHTLDLKFVTGFELGVRRDRVEQILADPEEKAP